MEGDGEAVDELMPFVWIPGGIGRLILEGCDWVEVAEGAISDPPTEGRICAPQSTSSLARLRLSSLLSIVYSALFRPSIPTVSCLGARDVWW